MDQQEIKHFIEAALLAAGRPLNIDQLKGLFDGRMAPEKSEIRQAIADLNTEYEERGIVISEVASGFRMQVKAAMADRLGKLWEERPPRYSRALFETLALIAYRQPITRGEIEEIRGVSVSANITRQLLERDWVRVVGHRDVPGRPEMFGTTKGFLDYFSLKKLDDLPPLADLSDWESLRVQLDLPEVENSGEVDSAADEAIADVASEAAVNDDNAEPVAAETTDIPVLYPEGEEPADNSAEDLAAEQAVEPENEQSVDEDDELVVSEWPNPVG